MTSSERWRLLEDLFTAASDLPLGQRDSYLRQACGADTDLRREVEALLAREDEDTEGGLISGIIEGTALNLLDDEPNADAMIGAELGNYRIIREIGRGGMGAVYLALRADRTFEKQVAIKLVKRGIDTDAVLQRFWHERRILAGLDHPFIARLVDGGTSPDGRPYFVMEYVDGKPLDAYVREKNLSIRERCEIFSKICEAISYAHRNLVIHRDLKPANILVTADGTPKLLDFGIARLLSVDPDERTIAGPVGIHALTPEFASPEQLRNDAVTTATDVYSLGATLRALLPQDNPVPPDLTTIIGKAMREEIDQRFASVADLREDIRRYLAGLPITARDQNLAYRAGKFVRRHRLGVAFAALVTLLLFGGIAGIIWEARRADAQRRRAEQRLSQALELADRTLKDVNRTLASLPGTIEARRQLVRNTLDYLDRLSKDAGEDPRVLISLATAYMRVSDVLGNSSTPNLGDLPGALATYNRAQAILKGLLEDDPDDVAITRLAAEAHQGTANILDSLGRTQESETEFRTAVSLLDHALQQHPEDGDLQFQSLDAHHSLGMVIYTGRSREVEEDTRRQLPAMEKLAAARPNDPEVQIKLSDYYALLGTVANRQDRLRQALDYYRRAAVVREAVYARNPRNTRVQRSLMIGYGHIGDMLGNPFTGCLGDYQGALVYYQKSAAIAEGMRRADPSDKRANYDTAMIGLRIGATEQAAGDLARSNAELDQAIARFEAMVAATPANVNYQRGLGIAYEFRSRNRWLQNDRAGALAGYRESLALAGRILANRSKDVSAAIQQIADEGPIATLLAISGDRAGAVRTAQQLTHDLDSLATDARRDIHLATSWGWYGQTYEALGDYLTAAGAFEKSAAAWKSVVKTANNPPYRAKLQDVLRRLAECQQKSSAR